MAGYSKTPFLQKMGVKEGMRGILLHVPSDIHSLFATSPINFETTLSGECDYIHLFIITKKELTEHFSKVKSHLKLNGLLWISWPKSRKLNTDLNENIIREIGLKLGLVDVKVAAIDDIWSGLKFVYRRKDSK